MRTIHAIAAILIAAGSTDHAGMPTPEDPAAPTYQELMGPDMFPDPQMGMVVESAKIDDGAVRVRTTGADIAMSLASGAVRFGQRIGHERPLAVLRFGTALQGAEITHSGPGFARVTFQQPAITVRVNGDSLFMVHVHEPCELSVDRNIEPAWHASHKVHHLIADEWGAFGLYCSDAKLDDYFDALSETVARYALPSDAVLWVGVCPPKPYDWERSLKDNVVWHWSRKTSYPPGDTLASWQDHGNIVLLQAEMMLWKDWNLEFIPRLGEAEFARVRDTIHDAGMRFIVYTSPYYFLRGTALEPRAMNSFENFKGWPPGTPTGENMGLFLPEIRRVMTAYKPDGLYFDGQYIHNPAALYALARESRNIVGEEGILEWHSTMALGSKRCYLPHADAYVDFILRGEGRMSAYADFDYLRYFVSGYNIHNSVGVICNNGPVKVTPELARNVLTANARFHTLVSWLDMPETMETLHSEYQTLLVPDLRRAVEEGVDARQASTAEKAALLRAERDALKAPPDWSAPTFIQRFDTLPATEQSASPRNEDPFSIRDGALHVRGHANTYAFLRFPVSAKATGVVVKLRQGSDGGQSWGPGAMLRWQNGGGLRLGTRSDGTLQSDVLGSQEHGSAYDPATWVWLRARWTDGMGVVERSSDGVTYERLWTFEHGGALSGLTAELLVGKVPYNGQPKDYAEPGGVGECAIAFVEVYGD